MTTKMDYKVSASIFMAFFLLIVIGNLMLASSFNFPDILRESPEARFTQFQNNQGIIIPTYCIMGLERTLLKVS